MKKKERLEARKEKDRKYNISEKGRARHKKYNCSEKGRARNFKYDHSDKGRLRAERWRCEHTPFSSEVIIKLILRGYKYGTES
jgi:hypothetical protein